MFGHQQQQQGMPQFPRMFGGVGAGQGPQFAAAQSNVARTPSVPNPTGATAQYAQPPHPQGQPPVQTQGLRPLGGNPFPVSYGQGVPQVAGNTVNRAGVAVGAAGGLGNGLQAPPSGRPGQPQDMSRIQRPEAKQTVSAVTPTRTGKNSPLKADAASTRTIADLKASLASKTKYITQLERELEARNQTVLNGPTGESPRGESIKKLKAQLAGKDALIDDLREEIRRLKIFMGATTSRPLSRPSPTDSKGTPSPRKSAGGLGSSGKFQAHPLLTGRPEFPYHSMNRDDPVDIRVEEFYNSTSSAVPLKRINRKFYAFGSAQVEIDVVNGKLLVRSEDGWNNGKYGAVEKFLVHYEPIEREKAGLPPLAY
ncbi:hypothetical protein FOL46_007949 [Perkinsus olseni]|uniref:Uncharacterized protein n=1 Tax=Perkinsus olseni TaxID=32597 RepID=A0A7J6MYX4_PEROL|nr:hypothetical protein FOL46_007949 [Perkinsus olseni]